MQPQDGAWGKNSSKPSFQPRTGSARSLAGGPGTCFVSPALISGRPCLRLVPWEGFAPRRRTARRRQQPGPCPGARPPLLPQESLSEPFQAPPATPAFHAGRPLVPGVMAGASGPTPQPAHEQDEATFSKGFFLSHSLHEFPGGMEDEGSLHYFVWEAQGFCCRTSQSLCYVPRHIGRTGGLLNFVGLQTSLECLCFGSRAACGRGLITCGNEVGNSHHGVQLPRPGLHGSRGVLTGSPVTDAPPHACAWLPVPGTRCCRDIHGQTCRLKHVGGLSTAPDRHGGSEGRARTGPSWSDPCPHPRGLRCPRPFPALRLQTQAFSFPDAPSARKPALPAGQLSSLQHLCWLFFLAPSTLYVTQTPRVSIRCSHSSWGHRLGTQNVLNKRVWSECVNVGPLPRIFIPRRVPGFKQKNIGNHGSKGCKKVLSKK